MNLINTFIENVLPLRQRGLGACCAAYTARLRRRMGRIPAAAVGAQLRDRIPIVSYPKGTFDGPGVFGDVAGLFPMADLDSAIAHDDRGWPTRGSWAAPMSTKA
jgi:hypothetical protein